MALMSAYKNSPYFDHYWERFAPLYEKHYEFLADFNMDLLRIMAGILAPDMALNFSETYIEPTAGHTDLRGAFEPVKRDAAGGIISDTYFGPYWQVFSDKHPFAPNLSTIDLIFCEGPAAVSNFRQQ
jgi:hypothetical protein